MKMSGQQILKIVQILSVVTIEELEFLTRTALETELEDIVAANANRQIKFFKVVAWVDKRKMQAEFVAGLAQMYAHAAGEIESVLAAKTTAALQVVDRFDRYFPSLEPFVNRHTLEQRLRELWDRDSGVLVVRGERYTGRSHSWLRIKAEAEQAGVSARYIDVENDRSRWDVQMLVDRLAGWMKVPRTDFVSGKAQDSRVGKNFISALDGHLAGLDQTEHRCLVLDSFDLVAVDKLLCEFVEALVGEALAGNLYRLSIILLGYGDLSRLKWSHMILDETVVPLCRDDVREFLCGVTREAGIAISDDVLDRETDAIMQGLPSKPKRDTLKKLASRVKTRSRALLGGRI